jgi:hypothetical protein
VNRAELRWLLQTIKDAETAERFVLAQDERGRIPFQLMADVASERGCINSKAILYHGTHHSTEYATPEVSIAIA